MFKACLELACPPMVNITTQNAWFSKTESFHFLHVCALLCHHSFLLKCGLLTLRFGFFLVCSPPPLLKPQLFCASSAAGFQWRKGENKQEAVELATHMYK